MGKQRVVLGARSRCSAPRRHVEPAAVSRVRLAVEHVTRRPAVEPGDQAQHRGLARAALPDDDRGRAAAGLERDVELELAAAATDEASSTGGRPAEARCDQPDAEQHRDREGQQQHRHGDRGVQVALQRQVHRQRHRLGDARHVARRR